MSTIPPGTLELLVLRTLQGGPMHGYAIGARLRQVSAEQVTAEEGSLYPALHRMERKGWLTSEWGKNDTGRRARFYSLTASGKARLKSERAQWRATTKMLGRVLGVDLA